jgi:hypothetical protein
MKPKSRLDKWKDKKISKPLPVTICPLNSPTKKKALKLEVDKQGKSRLIDLDLPHPPVSNHQGNICCQGCYNLGYKDGEDSLHNKSRKICWEDGYNTAIDNVEINIDKINYDKELGTNIFSEDTIFRFKERLKKLKRGIK